MTRAEHLNWCKQRALEIADSGDLPGAVASMASDMGKHDETRLDPLMAGFLTMAGIMDAQNGNTAAVRRWIEGFN